MKYLLIVYALNLGTTAKPPVPLAKWFDSAKACSAFINSPDIMSQYDVKNVKILQGSDFSEVPIQVVMKKDSIPIEVLDRIEMKW